MEELVDQIYEAAFLPELWVDVLGQLAELSGAQSGALLIIDQRLPPLYTATPNIIDTLAAFAETDHWYRNEPAHRLRRRAYPGFLERADFFFDEEQAPGTPWHKNLVDIGADWQIGSIVDMPGGEMALFTFERDRGLPDFDAGELARLNTLRPHLARASLMARRLMLEKAEERVMAMAALGIPAAIISRRKTVTATNPLFEELGEILRPAAFGGVAVKAREADSLIQEALDRVATGSTALVQTVPLHLEDESKFLVVHIIPLRRAASDIFDSGSALIAVMGYGMEANAPSDQILRGLFDLSPAEAAIARGLSQGQSVQEIARTRAISITTARTHLAHVFQNRHKASGSAGSASQRHLDRHRPLRHAQTPCVLDDTRPLPVPRPHSYE